MHLFFCGLPAAPALQISSCFALPTSHASPSARGGTVNAISPRLQLVELKNGEAYNGKMDSCDTWMNIHLKEVICTSKDGESFWRMKEVFIRGNTIKYVRVPDDTLGKAVEDKPRKPGARLAVRGLECTWHTQGALRPALQRCRESG